MGVPKPPNPVKLFVGMITQDPVWFEMAVKTLQVDYGPIDFEGFPQPWNHTEYYAQEFGDQLIRKFVFFERLIWPDQLWKIKRAIIEIERQMGEVINGRLYRRVNLDPGYLTHSKVVLSTRKDFSHRVYLQEGIYAEVTLIYQGKQFRPMPYTYPDYRATEYLQLFDQAREAFCRSYQNLP